MKEGPDGIERVSTALEDFSPRKLSWREEQLQPWRALSTSGPWPIAAERNKHILPIEPVRIDISDAPGVQ